MTSPYVLASPPVGPVGPSPRAPVGVVDTWTGWDGSVWDLSGRSGRVAFRPGVRGRHTPPVERHSSATAARSGSAWRGYRAGDREVFWPLRIFAADPAAWTDADRDFWRTMRPDRPGTWRVTAADGTSRSLTCRWESSSESYYWTPGMDEWAEYDVYLAAEGPWWMGPPLAGRWSADPGQVFFGGDAGGGYGPPWFLGSGQTLATASVRNPSDVDVHVTWWVRDATSATLGAGDGLVDVPFAVPAGRLLVVDTDPAVQTAVEIDAPPPDVKPLAAEMEWVAAHLPDGTDRTAELGATTSFAPMPPGEPVSLSLSAGGSGDRAVTMMFTPAYWRAW